MMKLYFKTSRFLMTSFAALTLMGHSGSALGSAFEADENLSSEVTRQAVTAVAIQYNEGITGSLLLALSDELILSVLRELPPEGLSKTAQTSERLNRLVNDDVFQRQYCGLTPAEYKDIVNVKIPAIFGEAYAPQVLALLMQHCFCKLFSGHAS